MYRQAGRSTLGSAARTLAATGLIVAVLALISPARVTGQQTGLIDDSTYVFALDGMVVEWSGAWQFDPDSSGQDVGVEVASLLSPLAGLLIGEIQGGTPVDLDQFLALVLDSTAEDADEFVTVERSATETVSYSLDAAVIDGIPAGMFTYIQPNPVTGTIIFTSVLAEANTFAMSVADAQQNVTVNGRVALEGIDGAALQDLLPDVSASLNDEEGDDDDRRGDEEDDEGSQEDADETEERPSFGDEDEDDGNDNRRLPRLEDDEVSENPEADLEALGIVEEGLYESPQFGTEVEWSRDWQPNPDLLSSDEAEGVDSIALGNEGGALVLISFFEAGDVTPADFAAFWESDDFLQENASEEAEVLLADSTDEESAVLIADVLDDGGELWTLRQAYSLDGGDTIAVVTMLALADDFPENLEEAQDGIGIDGADALSLFSVSDVENAA